MDNAMEPTVDQPPETLRQLERQCRLLEGECARYVRSLETTNQDLAQEIDRRQKAEAAIARANAELETVVERRTREIRLLKDRLRAENAILKQELAASRPHGTIIGESLAVKTVIAQIERVAPTDANVLIHGASG